MRRLRVLQHHRAQRKPRSRKSLREFERSSALPTCPEPWILSFSGRKKRQHAAGGSGYACQRAHPSGADHVESPAHRSMAQENPRRAGHLRFLLTKGGVICHAAIRLRHLRHLHHRRYRCHRSHHTRRTSSFPPRIARSFSCTQAE